MMDAYRRMTPVEAKLNELIEEAYDALHLDGMLETDPQIPPRPRPSEAKRLLVRARDALQRAAPRGDIATVSKHAKEAEELIKRALRGIPEGSRARASVEAALAHVRRRTRDDLQQAVEILVGVISSDHPSVMHR